MLTETYFIGDLAEMIFERDKERGGGVVLTTPTTNDAVAVENHPAPQGMPIFCPSDCVAPPRHSQDYVSSSRLAYEQNLGFQITDKVCFSQLEGI